VKKFVIIMLIIVCIVALVSNIHVVNAEDLSAETIENRNGKLIIERVVGTVTDNDGNGHAIYDNSYYICYQSVKCASNGDRVVSYFIYNPLNNCCDDIIWRFDYILK
jgi:hypothetical protein